MVWEGVSYAKNSRYDITFINKSSFYKKEARILQRAFSESYLLDKQRKQIKKLARARIIFIRQQMVAETKEFFKQNPLYWVHWPDDKSLILKYGEIIEKQKRK